VECVCVEVYRTVVTEDDLGPHGNANRLFYFVYSSRFYDGVSTSFCF